MNDKQNRVIHSCVEQLEKGSLTKDGLLEAFEAVSHVDNRRQDLLYLQSAETGIDAYSVGFRMVCDGQFVDEPEREEDWPYHNVLEAIHDGWRVISFPNMPLCLDENRTYGLGFEYILERSN